MSAPQNQLAPAEPRPAEQARAPFAGLSPEELAGQRRTKRLPGQTLILLLVLAVSTASLMWMRREGTRAGVNFTELKVSYEEPDAEKARTYARIMADLSRIQTPLDLALGEFGKSPFMLDTGTTVVEIKPGLPMPVGLSPEEIAAREAAAKAEARKQEVLAELATFQLASVMGGRSPLARISGDTYRVGDRVGENFTVTAIEGRSVTLTADGESYTISMEEPGEAGPKASPVKMGKPR